MTETAPHEHDWHHDPELPDAMTCGTPQCDVRVTAPGNHHPYRRLRTPAGKLTTVDEDVCDIVTDLWAAGVETLAACQGGCADATDGGMLAYLSYRPEGHDAVAERFAGREGVVWEQRVLRNTKHASRCIRWPAVRPCPKRGPEDEHKRIRELLREADVHVSISAGGVTIEQDGTEGASQPWTPWEIAVARLCKKLGVPTGEIDRWYCWPRVGEEGAP